MIQPKQLAKAALALAFALVFWGCGGGTATNAPQLSPAGKHPSNWPATHYAEYIKNPDACRSCHGSTTDPALAGGISGVSCFTCHSNGPSHGTGWAAPGKHGRMGAQLAPSPYAGFAYCAKCHGSNYDNAAGTTAVSCKACHTTAPHPMRPWSGTNASAPNHTMTHVDNAPECAKCHTNGANSFLKPKTPAPAGSLPGCFNNTLCHGRSFE
jgi:hypothetical protein